jgi:hypothetical protein
MVLEFRREFRCIADVAVLPRELPESGELVYSDAHVRVKARSIGLLGGDAQCLRLIQAAASGRWSWEDYMVPAEAMPALVRELSAALTQAMETAAKAAEAAPLDNQCL